MGKKLLAKISERSEQKANCILSLFIFLLGGIYSSATSGIPMAKLNKSSKTP